MFDPELESLVDDAALAEDWLREFSKRGGSLPVEMLAAVWIARAIDRNGERLGEEMDEQTTRLLEPLNSVGNP